MFRYQRKGAKEPTQHLSNDKPAGRSRIVADAHKGSLRQYEGGETMKELLEGGVLGRKTQREALLGIGGITTEALNVHSRAERSKTACDTVPFIIHYPGSLTSGA